MELKRLSHNLTVCKCGFHYHHTAYNVPCAIEGVLRTEHITCLSKEEWQSVR